MTQRDRNGGGKRLATAGIVAALIANFSSAEAADVDQLEAQMRAMQAQLQEVKRQVDAEKAQAAATTSSNSSVDGDALDLKVKWKGAPELSSADGKFKFKVRGRLNVDYNGINQDKPITGDPDVSAVELRRARLGVEGVMFYDWVYKFELDFAGDKTAIKDAYVEYTGLPVDLKAGHFKTYNSLEAQMSANYITFMEKAAFIEAFTIDRLIGGGVSYDENKHWTAEAGIFGTAPEAGQTTYFDDGTTLSARLTAAPLNRERRVVHLGASVRDRDAPSQSRDGSEDPLFLYRARGADLHLADRFVFTPQFGQSDTLWALEGAVVLGSFSVQGEYAQDTVHTAAAQASADPTYDGWYVDASWFLTGESRPYANGQFVRVKVKNPVNGGSGGWGAWQVAGRYDVVDLSDQSTAIAGCTGCGEQETWLIGVNWYLNDYTRLMFNVNQSEINGGINDGAEIAGIGMRAQLDW
ncbi:Porin P precursor [Methyloligella halotolerans]|uniref:Porin P n=1 Tax=Methyloligella halotolerans TaxID=1177755 RepID=A0A1E2RVA2_9HYPH|nr:porin [Methyloligella halotolerans]ODA66164.1 Porin P precursor [Methyloligella halotolerans]